MAKNETGLIAAIAVAAFLAGGLITYVATQVGTGPRQSVSQPAPSQTATTPDAPETRAPDDVVVARVDGTEIYRSDLMEAHGQLPPQAQQMGLEALYPLLLDRVIDTRLIMDEAGRRVASNDAEVARQMDDLRERVMMQVYFERMLDELLTEERFQAQYEEYLAANPPQEEVRARHILVETEDKAKEVIAEIEGGGDFAEAAKTHSTGPSGPGGGDLGYFTREQMVAPFADAAFAMQPGDVSSAPVQTQFGWHVIKVEDRRTQSAPSLDELRDQFSDELTRDIATEMVEGLRAKATIERFDIEGNPLPADGEPAAEEGAAPQQQ